MEPEQPPSSSQPPPDQGDPPSGSGPGVPGAAPPPPPPPPQAPPPPAPPPLQMPAAPTAQAWTTAPAGSPPGASAGSPDASGTVPSGPSSTTPTGQPVSGWQSPGAAPGQPVAGWQPSGGQPAAPPQWSGQPVPPAGGPPPSTWRTNTSGGSGAGKACIIIAAILIIGLVGLVIVGLMATTFFFGQVGFDGDGTFEENCPFLTASEAREVLGGDPSVVRMSGVWELLGLVVDARALPEAEDCWVDGGETGDSARVARHQGGDAARVYAETRQSAEPVSEDRGGGITVTSDGWIHRDLSGVGDEAFCTTSDMAGRVGAVVRFGDRVVAVSVQPYESDSGRYETDLDAGNLVSEEMCQAAVALARLAAD